MIRILPGRSVAFQEAQQLSSPHGFSGCFDQEGASAPWSDDRVDFLYQIVGQQNMSAFAFHELTLGMCLLSVS
jgi:hypothetical protein